MLCEALCSQLSKLSGAGSVRAWRQDGNGTRIRAYCFGMHTHTAMHRTRSRCSAARRSPASSTSSAARWRKPSRAQAARSALRSSRSASACLGSLGIIRFRLWYINRL